jgi:glycosyltransferase involved in cell wall biosynthesis
METGGAQRVLLDQARWFHHKGYRVVTAFLYDKEGLHAHWQTQVPVPLINLRARSRNADGIVNAFNLMGGSARAARMIAAGEFGAVETFGHHANLIGLTLAWLAGVPIRVGTHHGQIHDFPDRLLKLHTRLVNGPAATRVVAVSERSKAHAVEEGIRPEKITVIPNGVSLPEFGYQDRWSTRAELGVHPDAHLVLTAGRLSYEKAQTFLLQAVPTVLEQFPDTVFAIAGDGPLKTDLIRQARELGVQNRVRFLGIRRDVPRLMASADLFVLSSRSEGLPMVLLEAMGMQAAVVAADVGGVSEVIRHGQTGLLTPPEDAPALAAAICSLLENSEKREELGLAGKELVQRDYTLDGMCMRYAALLDPGFVMETG